EAMRATAATSPFYSGWVSSTEDYLRQMLVACRAGDFTRIGEITESHALRMHGLIQSTVPPIRFLNPTSYAIFDAVAEAREQGIDAYSTPMPDRTSPSSSAPPTPGRWPAGSPPSAMSASSAPVPAPTCAQTKEQRSTQPRP